MFDTRVFEDMKADDVAADRAAFKAAIELFNKSAKSPILDTDANYRKTRGVAIVESQFAVTAILVPRIYQTILPEIQEELEHEAPPAPIVRKRDDSGDK